MTDITPNGYWEYGSVARALATFISGHDQAHFILSPRVNPDFAYKCTERILHDFPRSSYALTVNQLLCDSRDGWNVYLKTFENLAKTFPKTIAFMDTQFNTETLIECLRRLLTVRTVTELQFSYHFLTAGAWLVVQEFLSDCRSMELKSLSIRNDHVGSDLDGAAQCVLLALQKPLLRSLTCSYPSPIRDKFCAGLVASNVCELHLTHWDTKTTEEIHQLMSTIQTHHQLTILSIVDTRFNMEKVLAIVSGLQGTNVRKFRLAHVFDGEENFVECTEMAMKHLLLEDFAIYLNTDIRPAALRRVKKAIMFHPRLEKLGIARSAWKEVKECASLVERMSSAFMKKMSLLCFHARGPEGLRPAVIRRVAAYLDSKDPWTELAPLYEAGGMEQPD